MRESRETWYFTRSLSVKAILPINTRSFNRTDVRCFAESNISAGKSVESYQLRTRRCVAFKITIFPPHYRLTTARM